jgi:hypothetical protein
MKSSRLCFTQAYFFDQATFYGTELGEKPGFSDVLFENAQKVLFSVPRLHASSFINTNVTSVRFSKSVNWEKETIDSSVDLEALKVVYRNLRENYENSFRFADARIYHTREMNLKRKYREKGNPTKGIRPLAVKNCLIRRTFSLTALYYVISEYGYDYNRAIIAAAVVLAIPIIYSLIQQSLSPEGIDINKSIGTATNYTKDVLHIDRKNDLLGPLIGIVTIPILGGIILAALKRTFDIRRKS